MKAKVMTIGPELALQMLQKNGRNRPISARAVNRYANDMAFGKWSLNGEPIILDENGDLMDGQHRLQAVVKSGTTIQFLVVTGADPEAFDTIDIGNMRGGGDVLGIKGYTNTRTMAAILRVTHLFKTQGFVNTSKVSARPVIGERRIDYLELAETYLEASDAAAYMASRTKHCPLFRPASFSGAMYIVFGEENAVARDKFFEALSNLESEYATEKPIIKLRKSYDTITTARQMKDSTQYRFEQWDKAFRDFCKIIKAEKRQTLWATGSPRRAQTPA